MRKTLHNWSSPTVMPARLASGLTVAGGLSCVALRSWGVPTGLTGRGCRLRKQHQIISHGENSAVNAKLLNMHQVFSVEAPIEEGDADGVFVVKTQ